MRFAYADPPYIGQAKRHYSADPKCAEVDHQELIARLCSDYDAWALSLSTPTLKQILSYCPDNVRVGAWVKPFASFKPGVNPAYAWEPVVFRGGAEARQKGADGSGLGLLQHHPQEGFVRSEATSVLLLAFRPCWASQGRRISRPLPRNRRSYRVLGGVPQP